LRQAHAEAGHTEAAQVDSTQRTRQDDLAR
jgi:hypothetical protein